MCLFFLPWGFVLVVLDWPLEQLRRTPEIGGTGSNGRLAQIGLTKEIVQFSWLPDQDLGHPRPFCSSGLAG